MDYEASIRAEDLDLADELYKEWHENDLELALILSNELIQGKIDESKRS